MLPLLVVGFSSRVRLSKSSAALPVNAGFGPEDSVANDILSGDPASGLGTVFEEDASRNGFRETGRGGGSKGESCPSDKEGDAARLRKGLLEERLSVSPGDGRESAWPGWVSDIVAMTCVSRIKSCRRNRRPRTVTRPWAWMRANWAVQIGQRSD